MQSISVQTFKQQLAQENAANTLVIDVRTPGEYRAEHILGVSNVPLDELESHLNLLQQYHHIYVHCASGNRSKQACQKLNQLGLTNIINVEGGLNGWKQVGFPVARTGSVISIMRQVQIAAGSLVLLGILLTLVFNFNFIYVSAFIGVGLVYAGVSGTCLMGDLLGRMPWNR